MKKTVQIHKQESTHSPTMRGSMDLSPRTMQTLFLLREMHQKQRFSMEGWSPRQPLPGMYQKARLPGRKQMSDKQHMVPFGLMIAFYPLVSSQPQGKKFSYYRTT